MGSTYCFIMRAISILFLCFFIHEILGHGGMYYPWTWHSSNTPSPNETPKHFHFTIEAPVPEKHCQEDSQRASSDRKCKFHMGKDEWYTNYTFIPGEPTLPDDMWDEFTPHPNNPQKPWYAPGTAPTWGEGCGANGGNPNGCGTDEHYGGCCGGSCGGYVGGKSAMEHAAEGLFDQAPYVEWTRGEPAEVYWYVGADHRGGYAYRICKVPPSGISGVTEKCFNDGHLDFYGDTAWIYYHSNQNFDPELWEPIQAVRTKTGTYPPNSEWAKMALPIASESGAQWAFKDLVQVPENIQPGDYILSFRWDSQKTAQVWNSCANIRIV